MRKIVITHVGTSALDCYALRASSFPDQKRLNEIKNDSRWEDTDLISFKECLYTGLCKVWSPLEDDIADKRRDSPAEIASLNMLGLNEGDRVVLVSSDTNAGTFCATLLRHCLTSPTDGTPDEGYVFRPERLDVPKVQVLRGVEASSDNGFIETGLPAYMALVGNQYNAMNREQDKLIFNITGGYKGIIPFAVLAAQLLGAHTERGIKADVIYMHETSTNLITLGPQLPICWDELCQIYVWIRDLRNNPENPDVAHNVELLRRAIGYPNPLADTIYYLIQKLAWC